MAVFLRTRRRHSAAGIQSVRCTALTRRPLRWFSYVRELSAGAAFVPAGYSSGTGDCARGGTAGGGGDSEFGMRNWDAGDERVWRLWFWRNGRPRFALGSAVLARFALGSCPALRFCRGFALSSRPAFRFYRCVLPLARVQGLRFCWGVLHSAHTRLSVSAAVLSLAHPVCVILPRCFALGTCPALRFWRNCLPSAHAQHCGSSATVCTRLTPGLPFLTLLCLRLTPSIAVLAQLLALGTRPGLAFLLGRFASVHACCLPHSDKQDGLRCVAFLFRRVEIAFVRSRGVGAVICLCGFTSGLCVYLWRSRRGRGNGVTEVGGACESLRNRIGRASLFAGSTLGLRAPDCAKESSTLWTLFTLRRGCVGTYSRPLCVFAQPHWPCKSFRGEYAGAKCGSRTAAAPRLRQRVECGSGTAASLDSLHAAAGLP